MRILQAIKTADGANWAVLQVQQLVKAGFDVHVALPEAGGREIDNWRRTGAILHSVDLTLPVGRPWQLASVLRRGRDLVRCVDPDVIHSHFVTTTLALRLALGRDHPIPRLFQVPGPLHLEDPFFARLDLASAGPRDHWLASSHHIRSLYAELGVPVEQIGVSYYGTRVEEFPARRSGKLRRLLGIPENVLLVGNVSYMYPPKLWLGHTVGVKCMEDVIDALATVTRCRDDVVGVVIGGAWGSDQWYERRLRRRARRKGGRILMPGFLPHATVQEAWADLDLVVHVPLSENCGGVHEAMVAGVPVIASHVGGLPELVIDGVTGWLVPPRQPHVLARTILEVLDAPQLRAQRAARGAQLVRTMFDVTRTAPEVGAVYRHLVDPQRHPLPAVFNPDAVLATQQAAHAGGRSA
jgi:glycosyltransferase involved in cell wall biosynthesis